jgi:hypothetical protein
MQANATFRMSERRSPRVSIDLRVIAIQDGLEIPGKVLNLSGGGVHMALDPISSAAMRSGPMELEIAGIGRYPSRIVWKAVNSLGAEFLISDSMRQLVEHRIAALGRSMKEPTGRSTEPPLQVEAVEAPELPPPSSEAPPPASTLRIVETDQFTDLRRSPRIKVNLGARCFQGGYDIPCQILDISEGGARMRFDSIGIAGVRDDTLNLQIPGYGQYHADFRWRQGSDAGAEFRLTDRQREHLSNRIRTALRDGAVSA